MFDVIVRIFIYVVFYCLQAGREGREKFGRREKRMNPNASSTNKEKRKKKNFMMVRHKVQKAKGKRSYHDKQVR